MIALPYMLPFSSLACLSDVCILVTYRESNKLQFVCQECLPIIVCGSEIWDFCVSLWFIGLFYINNRQLVDICLAFSIKRGIFNWYSRLEQV